MNARPLISGWPGHVEFDHPSSLCQRLARGDVDLALVSSFEFLRNPIYRIVDDLSISSAGPVYSVVVAHRGEISQVEEIELDPAAETSVKLLRCLLAELKLSARVVSTASFPNVSSARTQRARLLIGDQAIRFRQAHADEFRFWDLGEQWKKLVGQPFVYMVKAIADRLRILRDDNLAKIDSLIAEEKEFDRDFCQRYYRENLRFNFGEREKKGLRQFHKRCVELRLFPAEKLKLRARSAAIPLRLV